MLYRVWKIAHRVDGAVPGSARRLLFSVDSPREACVAIEQLRARERGNPAPQSGTYGLEVRSADGWIEWHDRRGHDVIALL